MGMLRDLDDEKSINVVSNGGSTVKRNLVVAESKPVLPERSVAFSALNLAAKGATRPGGVLLQHIDKIFHQFFHSFSSLLEKKSAFVPLYWN